MRLLQVLSLLIFLTVNQATAQTADPFCGTTGGANAVGRLGSGLNPPPDGPLFLRIYVYKVGNAAGQYFPSDTWDIANIPNSNGEVLIDYTLTVESGATLTINPGVTVRFGEQGQLIIKPNARLKLHGTLTSLGCTLGWEGVEVWGSHASTQKSQYPVDGAYAQGILETFSGSSYHSVIENARTAVKLYGPLVQYSGGQLYGTGAHFHNNSKGVVFAKYQNYYPYSTPSGQQGQPRPYRAYFTDCIFTVDDMYPHAAPFHSFLYLDAVEGLSISACTFTNDQNIEGTTVTDWGYGIFSIDAGFTVRGVPTVSPCPYPCTDYIPSEFNKLGYGIYTVTSLTNRPFVIKESAFNNCFVGLRNTSVTGATVILNDFTLGEPPAGTLVPISGNPIEDDSLQHQIGIIFEKNISGWECQENTFVKSGNNPDVVTIGIMALATGDGAKTIRKNTFSGLAIGNLANDNNIDANSSDGRLYECNKNYDVTDKDFSVPDGWIKRDQGTAITNPFGQITGYEAAGNRFSYTGIDFSCFLAPGSGFNLVRYHYNPGAQNEDPLTLEGNIGKFQAENNTCESRFCEPPCRDETEVTGMKSEYFIHENAYQTLLADYAANPTEQIETALDYHRRLMSENTYMIVLHILYDTVTYQTDSLHTWIKNLDNLGSMLWLASEELADGNAQAAHQWLEEAANKYSLTTEQQDDLDLYDAIIDLLDGKSVYTLDSITLDALRNYANGYAASWAQNILTSNGDYFPPDYILEGVEERNGAPLTPQKKPFALGQAEVTAVPNPAKEIVYFYVSNPEQTEEAASLQIFDAMGNRVALVSVPPTPEITLRWETGANTSGLYFYCYVRDGQVAQSGKIILFK